MTLDLCLRKTRSGKSRDYRDVIRFQSKSFVFKMFSFHAKTQCQLFKFLRFEERLREAQFGDGLVYTDCRANRRNNAAAFYKFLQRNVDKTVLTHFLPIKITKKNRITAKESFKFNFISVQHL